MSQASSFIINLNVRIASKVASQYIHELWIKLMRNACSCKEYKKCLVLKIKHSSWYDCFMMLMTGSMEVSVLKCCVIHHQ